MNEFLTTVNSLLEDLFFVVSIYCLLRGTRRQESANVAEIISEKREKKFERYREKKCQ